MNICYDMSRRFDTRINRVTVLNILYMDQLFIANIRLYMSVYFHEVNLKIKAIESFDKFLILSTMDKDIDM